MGRVRVRNKQKQMGKRKTNLYERALLYTKEVQEMFYSFVQVISSAIDERSPYNARHTRSMVRNGTRLIAYCNQQYYKNKTGIYFSQNRREQFIMSIWLHDIGKMVIPNHIMNKDSRMGWQREKEVQFRFEKMLLLNEIDTLKGVQTEKEEKQHIKEMNSAWKLIKKMNRESQMTKEQRRLLVCLGQKTYTERSGERKAWLNKEDIECLLIERGTLTEAERVIMESHAAFTDKLLGQIRFPREYSHVHQWASSHHEYLNGSGYPKGLSGEQIPIEVRLITILDIFDALTAADRPYKSAVSIENALQILDNMAGEGKLDKNLVLLFKQSRCWKE